MCPCIFLEEKLLFFRYLVVGVVDPPDRDVLELDVLDDFRMLRGEDVVFFLLLRDGFLDLYVLLQGEKFGLGESELKALVLRGIPGVADRGAVLAGESGHLVLSVW